MFECLSEIAARHPGEVVGIITHGAILSATLTKMLACDVDSEFASKRFVIKNTSMTVAVRKSSGHWVLHALGDTAHLDSWTVPFASANSPAARATGQYGLIATVALVFAMGVALGLRLRR